MGPGPGVLPSLLTHQWHERDIQCVQKHRPFMLVNMLSLSSTPPLKFVYTHTHTHTHTHSCQVLENSRCLVNDPGCHLTVFKVRTREHSVFFSFPHQGQATAALSHAFPVYNPASSSSVGASHHHLSSAPSGPSGLLEISLGPLHFDLCTQ